MLVVFAVRTRLPFMRSRPSRLMLGVTLVMAVMVMVIPYSPLAGVLGFTPLPPLYLGMLLAIVVIYFVSAELMKRWFYRQLHNRG